MFVSVIVLKSEPPELVPTMAVPFHAQLVAEESAGIVKELVPVPPVTVTGTGIEPPVMSIVRARGPVLVIETAVRPVSGADCTVAPSWTSTRLELSTRSEAASVESVSEIVQTPPETT